jgi:ethanolamine permease
MSMAAVLTLRKKEPALNRPFKVPFYPFFPWIALVIAVVSLIAMTSLNLKLSFIYFGILAIAYLWFYFFVKPTLHVQQPLS